MPEGPLVTHNPKLKRNRDFRFQLLICVIGVICGCSYVVSASLQVEKQKAFFENVKKLCGRQFEGETVFPSDVNHPMVGKKLVVRVETCGDKEIRIPFQVGEDKSRTWVLTMTKDGLLLKHDHRHADGTPDRITDYGGSATAAGTQFRQSFPADAVTAKLIPEASTNVWTLEIIPDKQQLTYYLERHGQRRYKAVLGLR
ncbi:MAG TPA: hypothetical protein VF074_15555 [Pyrinomonadaceae bacterium]